jgi:CRP-like cAMP-binding protein
MPLDTGNTTKNRLLAALPSKILDELYPDLHAVSLAQRQILYTPGAPIEHVYFFETGVASVLTNMADGGAIEVGMIGAEGIVGVSALLGAAMSSHQTIVQVPGTALRMKAARFKAAFDQLAAVRRLALGFVDALLNLSGQTAACNRLHSLEQRCARWLLMASDRIGSDNMPMTHEFLSTMLGVRRAGVTVAAIELQRSGLIQYNRGHLTIADHDGLAGTACECYRVDHERFTQLYQ